MKPTNEERREVAARLRMLPTDVYEVGKQWRHEGVETECQDQTDYYLIHQALFGCLPAEHMHLCDYKKVHARLADLIEPEPERTCRMEYDPVHCDYVCTACGEWHDTPTYDARDADDALVYRDYRFCPHCGARVEGAGE